MGIVAVSGPSVAHETRAGSVTLTALDLTKAVTFPTSMPNANYRVAIERGGNAASVLWVTSKATTGFTLNASVGVTETVGYIAVADN